MRKFFVGAAGVVMAFSVGVTQAGAAEYKGNVVGKPNAKVTIQVKKESGDRYVTRVGFKNIPVQCESGSSSTGGSGTAGESGSPGIEVKGREFSGGWQYGSVSGKFRGSGKLVGALSISVDAGGPQGQCDSGILDYRASD